MKPSSVTYPLNRFQNPSTAHFPGLPKEGKLNIKEETDNRKEKKIQKVFLRKVTRINSISFSFSFPLRIRFRFLMLWPFSHFPIHRKDKLFNRRNLSDILKVTPKIWSFQSTQYYGNCVQIFCRLISANVFTPISIILKGITPAGGSGEEAGYYICAESTNW